MANGQWTWGSTETVQPAGWLAVTPSALQGQVRAKKGFLSLQR